MPKIAIELTTGDNSLVNVVMELFSIEVRNGAPERRVKHQLGIPVQSGGKFVFTSQADLPQREYGVWLYVAGSGNSASVSVRDAELVYPEQPDWPVEVTVPGTQTKRSRSCYFIPELPGAGS